MLLKYKMLFVSDSALNEGFPSLEAASYFNNGCFGDDRHLNYYTCKCRFFKGEKGTQSLLNVNGR